VLLLAVLCAFACSHLQGRGRRTGRTQAFRSWHCAHSLPALPSLGTVQGTIKWSESSEVLASEGLGHGRGGLLQVPRPCLLQVSL